MRVVRILIPTGRPGLDYEEDNSKQKKRDTIEFHISTRRPRFRGRRRSTIVQV